MENWIKNNSAKLMLCAGLFICFCFYSVVRTGGSFVPRMAALQSENLELRILVDYLINHIHPETNVDYTGIAQGLNE